MPTPLFHIGAGSRPSNVQQLNVEKSIISVVTNTEDDEILTLEKSNVEYPSGPSEVEKTAGEGDTAHESFNEKCETKSVESQANTIIGKNSKKQIPKLHFNDSSSCSATDSKGSEPFVLPSTTVKRMKRSCRIVVSEGDTPKNVKDVNMKDVNAGDVTDKKRKQKRSPEERNKKRQARLVTQETQGNSEAKYCECGEIEPKHGYYIKADDMTIYTKCLGSRAQTDLRGICSNNDWRTIENSKRPS
ncbi:hypothetical protein JTB14_026566 [Gonioctena quinquepunctata]|nr:hypothetical protein JTB14_026566 [Gonioctena quinquepunctata]